jgi:peptidyl-prolyl cis-trans isomerase SurA
MALSFTGRAQSETIMTIAGTPVPKEEFVNYYRKNNQNLSDDSLKLTPKEYLNLFINYKLKVLETKNPEFRALISEHNDENVLFNLTEEKIRNKSRQDSAGLRAYYRQNPAKFKWGTRFNGWVIQCANQQVRDYIDQVFAEDPAISEEELTDLLNLNYTNQASVQKGIFACGQNELTDYLVWNRSKPRNYKDGLHFVRGDLIPPTIKTFNEAGSLYLEAYQKELESQLLKELRKKYKVRVNKKVLHTIESIK